MDSLPREFIGAIKSHFHNAGHSDVVIQTEPGSSKGDNFLGIITKATIATINKQGNKNTFEWIIKSASSDEKYRSVLQIPFVFEREAYMYQHVLAAFAKLQEELDIDKRFKSYPDLHLSYTNLPECFAMENMKMLGYEMKNRQEFLDLKHTMLVMKEFGRFHALSFALKARKPEIYETLKSNLCRQYFCNLQFDNTAIYNEKIKKGVQDVVSSDVLEKFERYSANYINNLKEQFLESQSDNFAVLGHLDGWVNNILFKYENENPTKLCFLDFQLSSVSSPAMDLSYFIFTCTSKELRDIHFDEMLKTYHTSLTSFLKDLSCNPELFPFEILQEHMKKYSTYGLFVTTIITYSLMSEVDEITEMTADNLENAEVSLHDIVHEDAYILRMKNVIEEFVRREYLQ